MDKRPIGVFDSGVGGLTVVKQIMKVMPHENIVYFGDTVGYGLLSCVNVLEGKNVADLKCLIPLGSLGLILRYNLDEDHGVDGYVLYFKLAYT